MRPKKPEYFLSIKSAVQILKTISIEKKTVKVRVPMDAKLVSPGGQETEVVGPEIP